VKSGLISIIYKKILKLNNESKQKLTSGEIVNLMSLDATKVSGVIQFL
jgi:hypothetical protein